MTQYGNRNRSSHSVAPVSERDRFGSNASFGQGGANDTDDLGGYTGGGRQAHSAGDDGRDHRQGGQFGFRDGAESQRYGQRLDRPSGLDRDYRGAGYAGPGGYGGGYGGQRAGSAGQEPYRDGQRGNQHFDPDYDLWRTEQLQALDDDYNEWRRDRFKKFSDEFSSWRSDRAQRSRDDNTEHSGLTGSSDRTSGDPDNDRTSRS